MDLSDLSKFPVNTRNYVVVPCISLEYENMHESMIGLKVTIGLGFYEGPTDSGVITGYDEKKIHLKVGSKIKKYDYDPTSIELQVYQFDKRIMFSNERVSEAELASSHKNFYHGSVGDHHPPEKKEESHVEEIKKPRKKRATSKKKESTKAEKTSQSSYQPKFGIQWS